MSQTAAKGEKVRKPKQKKGTEEKNKGIVVLPYMKGVTEQLKRVFAKHRIATSAKPYHTIRNVLVHPKDKIETQDQTGVVYKIGCSNCSRVYI